jgi:hypothetical protein
MIEIEWKTVEEHGWPEDHKLVLVTDGNEVWTTSYFQEDDFMGWYYDYCFIEDLPITHYADVLDQIKLPEVE